MEMEMETGNAVIAGMETVSAEGIFSGVRFEEGGRIVLSFDDAVVGSRPCGTVYVLHGECFESAGLMPGCRVRFMGKVRKSSCMGGTECWMYSCQDVSAGSRDVTAEFSVLGNTIIGFEKICFTGKGLACSCGAEPWNKFSEDYDIPDGFRASLVYNPAGTLRNGTDIEFDLYDGDGKMAEFDRVVFNPYGMHRGIFIDGKYFVGVCGKVYEKLCMLYYVVFIQKKKQVFYIPEEAVGDYLLMLGKSGTILYYMGERICSISG